MRVGLLGQVRRVWAPRGVKVEQFVECKYEWAYLNLAVGSLTGLSPSITLKPAAKSVSALSCIMKIMYCGASNKRSRGAAGSADVHAF